MSNSASGNFFFKHENKYRIEREERDSKHNPREYIHPPDECVYQHPNPNQKDAATKGNRLTPRGAMRKLDAVREHAIERCETHVSHSIAEMQRIAASNKFQFVQSQIPDYYDHDCCRRRK